MSDYYVLKDAHFIALGAWAAERVNRYYLGFEDNLSDESLASAYGDLLRDANIDFVQSVEGETLRDYKPLVVTNQQIIKANGLRPIDILKMCATLESQCHYPGWLDSDAYMLLECIKCAALCRLAGYDNAIITLTDF